MRGALAAASLFLLPNATKMACDVKLVFSREAIVTKLMTTFLTGVALAACATAVSAQSNTLSAVKARGVLNCGVGTGLAGFGMPDAQGFWSGLDVDVCRAVASAIFDDPTKIKFVSLSAKDRFTALQAGEVDLLSRTTTWTMSRDTSLGFNFGGINYYDGQGFMVRKKMNVTSVTQMNGASICTQQGTTTELNLADFFRSNKMKYEIVTFATNDETVKAYEAGRCDSFTTDASGLYAERLKLADQADHIILPEIISKEPLASVVRHNDDQWFDLVKWTHYMMINAEELGVTKANVADMAKSDNPEIKRLLGTEGKYGESIGLTNDWGMRIIRHVGNYGESFERNVGSGSRLKIARGQNNLWTKGGLQYAPPIR
jgi:general L-amino acid transport system substrate-binding protein